MDLELRRFGIGSGRTEFDKELPSSILVNLNSLPGFALEDLGDHILLEASEEVGFVTMPYAFMCAKGLTTPSDWIAEDSQEILFYQVLDENLCHVYWLHAHWE